MRTFGILSGAAPPPNLEAASNMSWSWDEFLAMTCVDEQGDIEQQNCTNWDTCETTGTMTTHTCFSQTEHTEKC